MNWPQCGQPIGRWTVDRMIGEGSFGTVYLVHETHTGQVAALKINLGLNVTATPDEFRAERDNVSERIVPEHTTDFYDSGIWYDREYYVMELAQPLSPSAKLSARRLFQLFRGFSYGIEAFHANGRIHCDIKPENLATVGGKPKILDLGCVRLTKNAKKHPERIGTWKYMAPEVRERKLLDIRADVYSFGVSFRELCPDHHLEAFGPFIIHATDNDPSRRTQTMAVARSEMLACYLRLSKARRIAFFSFMVICIGIFGWWWFNRWLYESRQNRVRTQRENIVYIMANVKAGLRHYENHEYSHAVKRLECAVSAKHFDEVYSQHNKVYRILAECYRDGKGVPRDLTKCHSYELRSKRNAE